MGILYVTVTSIELWWVLAVRSTPFLYIFLPCFQALGVSLIHVLLNHSAFKLFFRWNIVKMFPFSFIYEVKKRGTDLHIGACFWSRTYTQSSESF